jgi:hypothetical protein
MHHDSPQQQHHVFKHRHDGHHFHGRIQHPVLQPWVFMPQQPTTTTRTTRTTTKPTNSKQQTANSKEQQQQQQQEQEQEQQPRTR